MKNKRKPLICLILLLGSAYSAHADQLDGFRPLISLAGIIASLVFAPLQLLFASLARHSNHSAVLVICGIAAALFFFLSFGLIRGVWEYITSSSAD